MNSKLLLTLAISVLLCSFAYSAGLGVAPATLRFENALKGATTEKELTIQNPGEEPIFASIEIEGELKDWIKLEPEGRVEIPAKGSETITVMLTPPVSEANTEYSAKVHVKAEGSATVEGSGMGLLPGVSTDIIASITDKRIVEGKVSKILTKDEKYGNPVVFTIGFENHGNVPAGPDVKIEIDKRGTGIIDTIEESMEEIKPGTSGDYSVRWDTNGKEKNIYYRATVTVSLDGEVIEKKEEVGFRVLDEKTVTRTAERTETEKEGMPILTGIVVIAVIVILGLIVFFAVSRKK